MISDYLEQHWVMLVPLIGMSILLISDIHLERWMIRRIAITNFILFIYSLSSYVGSNLSSISILSVEYPFNKYLSFKSFSIFFFHVG